LIHNEAPSWQSLHHPIKTFSSVPWLDGPHVIPDRVEVVVTQRHQIGRRRVSHVNQPLTGELLATIQAAEFRIVLHFLDSQRRMILYEVTSNVSTEDVRVRGSSPSAIEGRAWAAAQTTARERTNRTCKNNRRGAGRTGNGSPRMELGSAPQWPLWLRKVAAWINKYTMAY